MSLPLPDGGAETSADGRRHAPSATRNAAPILAVLRAEAPAQGRLLEIASGTGQHAAEFAAALPGIDWQPSDVNPDNLVSINAWRAVSGAANLRPPAVLDAACADWAKAWPGQDVILLVNLLHLIPDTAAVRVVQGIAAALAPGGKALIYGPFLRDGIATSAGDAAFDANLRVQDPSIGYKDLAWVIAQLARYGFGVRVLPMPANNLMLITFRV